MNLLHDLRLRRDMSQQELAKATDLTANDISRFERHGRIGMDKVLALADYLHITVDALLTNDFQAVFAHLTTPAFPTHRSSLQMERALTKKCELGRQGEDWVYRQEIQKLRGTVYVNAVNPNYANELTAGYDILSYDRDGTPILIEVKTTRKDAEYRFMMSAEEYCKALECLQNGVRYEVHRVYHCGTPSVGRVIIPAETLLRDYTFESADYVVHRRDAA